MIITERPISINQNIIDLSNEIPSADQLRGLLDEAILAGIHHHEILAINISDPLSSRFVELLQEACIYDEHRAELAEIETLLKDSESLREVVAEMIRLNQLRHFNDSSWLHQQSFGSDIY